MAMKLDDMVKLMSMMRGNKPAAVPAVAPPKIELKSLGRQESVAGINGDVYEVTTRFADGREDVAEAVMSDNSDLAQLQKALRIMSGEMAKMAKTAGAMQGGPGGPPDMNALNETMKAHENKGMLRYGDQVKLVSFSTKNIAANRLKLPPVRKLPNMGKR